MDSEFGKVRDIYFNDQTWKVEFFVVSAGRGPSARALLLPVEAVASLDIGHKILRSSWTLAQFQNASSASSVLSVARQCEILTPGALYRSPSIQANPNLRGYHSLRGYSAISDKQSRGEISDLLLDDADWSIRYIQLQFPVQKKLIHFHLHALGVERFSCASRRVFLREFEPIQIEDPGIAPFPVVASTEASFG